MTQEDFSPTYTVIVSNAHDGEVATFAFDTTTGHLVLDEKYAAAPAVMPMALSPDKKHLFCATRGESRSIITYKPDLSTGHLERLGIANIASSLAYLCADPSGRYLLGASYGEHRLSIYSASRVLNADGTPLQVFDEIEHAHAVIVSADARFAYVSSLGSNRVICLAISTGDQGSPARIVEAVSLVADFGPRHLRFSPDGSTLYVLSEFQATVAAFHRDSSTGRLSSMCVSERPLAVTDLEVGRARPNFTAADQPDPATLRSLIWAADIQVTPDHRSVYVSERTSSRLICYRVQTDGSLSYSSYTDTETQPRGFQIDPTGKFIVACGELSRFISVYAIDADSGALKLLSRCEGGNGANWVELMPRLRSSTSTIARPL